MFFRKPFIKNTLVCSCIWLNKFMKFGHIFILKQIFDINYHLKECGCYPDYVDALQDRFEFMVSYCLKFLTRILINDLRWT